MADEDYTHDLSHSEEEEPVAVGPEPTAGVLVTAVNITLNVIGGGLLAIPVSFDQTSLYPGIALLMGMAFVSVFSMVTLTIVSQKTQCFSYKEMLSRCFGPKWAWAFDGVLIFYTYGILVGFGRIIADSMPKVAAQVFDSNSSFFVKDVFWLIVSAAIFLPLSSLRSLSLLKYSSVIGFITIMYLGVMVMIRFFAGSFRSDNGGHFIAQDIRWFHFDFGFLQAIPILSTSFSCHYNIPAYYAEMKDRAPKKMFAAIAMFAGFSIPFYLMVGVLCVLMFGHGKLSSKAAAGDVMNNFHFDDTAFNVARFGFFIQFLCSYPLVCLACRRAINVMFFKSADQKQWVLCLEAAVLVLSSCILAYLVPSIDDVFAINGAIFGLAIVVTVPGLIFLKTFWGTKTAVEDPEDVETALNPEPSPESKYSLSPSAVRGFCVVCAIACVFGVLSSGLSLAATIDHIVTK